MNKTLKTLVFVVALLFGGQAQAACVKWSDAKNIIAKHGLKKPGKVRSRAMRRGGEVLSINLCRKRGKYVYRMTVLGKKKRVREVVVDAHSGRGVRKKRKSGKKLENRIINRVRRNLRRHGINYY